MSIPVFRFAPSPNGPLHLGHALSALSSFDMAQKSKGRFLLRIEDIDVTRCREEYVAGILEDLTWLGLNWEEPVLRQSQHFAVYAEAAQLLEAQGLLYPCFAARSEIDAAATPEAIDPDGAPIYPGLHKGMAAKEIEARMENGERFALRLDMQRAMALAAKRLGGAPLTFTELDESGRPETVAAEPQRWGDAVILRKDVPASYHLAVVVDDARQEVTHVTRGRDLYAATGLHRLLQVLLGLPEPSYHHHRLLADSEGRKLSKSGGDTGLADLRAGGATSTDVRRMVGLL
ncbi:MAG: tRNA glutamyl-Q(34) synthetase GluQRS [Hyphomicrobium sp.]|jgi:glutamyl-Q tRNA(Asp) synthetase